ncbi:MAG: RnfABCDGE type electron transport complex subunit D [Dehalococcoidia bacterium]|nr:RnfABCDGE type electron transport complex subunit D [Dehalococcoidia bacterium]
MTAIAARPAPSPLRSLKKLVRAPKGQLLLIFAGILALAIPSEGAAQVLPGLIGAVAAAAIVDVTVARLHRHTWAFPDGGILTALIIAMVLSPYEDVIIPVAATVIALASKHLFRTRLANVFNPAALAIVVVSVLFDSIQSWWGALPEYEWLGVAVLIVAGAYIADRINKWPLVLTFLGTYFSLFTLASLNGEGAQVAEIFRAPDIHAVLFFVFFMADDPPTCPVKFRDQAAYAFIVAAAAFAVFQLFGWVYFLPAALLVGNAYEGTRKWLAQRDRKRRPAARPSAAKPGGIVRRPASPAPPLASVVSRSAAGPNRHASPLWYRAGAGAPPPADPAAEVPPPDELFRRPVHH